jgi:hypothetical protein
MDGGGGDDICWIVSGAGDFLTSGVRSRTLRWTGVAVLAGDEDPA